MFGCHAGHGVFLGIQDDGHDRILKNGQRILLVNDLLHTGRVFRLGALATRGPDCRTSASIEDLGLKGRGIRIDPHFTAKRIQFMDEVAFGETADGRIAGHPCDCIFARSDQKRPNFHSGCSESRLGASMATADDNQFINAFHGALIV